jgi:hypothetical protein
MHTTHSIFERTLADYFRQRLTALTENHSDSYHEDTLWYMGNMLARFGLRDHLFHYDKGELQIRPLALLYKDALETPEPHQRCLLLRHLGDMALFLCALFPERYQRRGIRKDYFLGMGGGAYSYLSENAQQNRHIFAELANKFAALLNLIAQACAKQMPFDAKDVLRLYRSWMVSGDDSVASQLQGLGISLPEPGQVH